MGLPRRAVAVVMLAGMIAIASADRAGADTVTVFDNYKPNFGAATFDGQVINPLVPSRDRDVANAFTPTASGIVSDIWATVTRRQGANVMDLWLMSDNNGVPDRVLEMWTVTNEMGITGGLNPPLHVQGDGSTFLQADEQYWLVASGPSLSTVAQWMYNGVGDTGPNLMRENGGSWTGHTGPLGALRGAFRVDVVPEPATLCIMAFGALSILRRRRRSVH